MQLDMEHTEIRIDTYQPCDEERERASFSYVMSLVAVVIGLPMPIINLLATGIFYLMSRRKSFYVRWHCMQALISQVPLFVMNNILFWWTVRILLCWNDLSSAYITYFIVVNTYNVFDCIETIRSAVQTRKGRLHRWWMYGALTDAICRPS